MKQPAILTEEQKKESRYRSLHFCGNEAGCKASLTVEASIVLPFFLIILMAVMSFFQLLQIQTRIQEGMKDAVSRVSGYYYALEKQEAAEEVGGEYANDILQLLQGGITAGYLKQKLLNSVGREYLDHSWIEGGSSGLIVLGSKFPDTDGNLDLVLTYRVRIPFLPGRLGVISITQRECQRAWQGSSDEGGNSEEDTEAQGQTVYITENGSVYHVSLTCSYLKLSIHEVVLSQIGQYRSLDGSRYRLCEKCGKGTAGESVWITDSGSRYHLNQNCSALRRGVRAVSLSEVSDRPCCSRCSKQGETGEGKE